MIGPLIASEFQDAVGPEDGCPITAFTIKRSKVLHVALTCNDVALVMLLVPLAVIEIAAKDFKDNIRRMRKIRMYFSYIAQLRTARLPHLCYLLKFHHP